MNFKTMNLLVQMRKTGFGLGFILGGLFMGAVMLWTGQAHAHDFKQGAIVIYHPYPANNPASASSRETLMTKASSAPPVCAMWP